MTNKGENETITTQLRFGSNNGDHHHNRNHKHLQ